MTFHDCDILVMLRKREYPFHSVDGVVFFKVVSISPASAKTQGGGVRISPRTSDRGLDVHRYCKIEEGRQTAIRTRDED